MDVDFTGGELLLLQGLVKLSRKILKEECVQQFLQMLYIFLKILKY